MRVGLRGLAKYRKVGALQERYLRRYIDDEKI